MVDFWKPLSVIFLGVVLTSSGQVLFAKWVKDRSATQSTDRPHWRQIRDALGDRRAAVGILCMLIAFPLGLVALEMADVSVAVPLGALSYILATVMGKFYLGEQVGALRWLGVITIVMGTVLIGISACTDGALDNQ